MATEAKYETVVESVTSRSMEPNEKKLFQVNFRGAEVRIDFGRRKAGMRERRRGQSELNVRL
jgi:hypothetical protein